MSGADLIAPASHGHGHGRRGHSRSRFAAVPNSISLSTEQPSTQPYPPATQAYMNGHTSNDSVHSHHGPHSEAHSHSGHTRHASTYENIAQTYASTAPDKAFFAGQINASSPLSTGYLAREELFRGLLVTLPWVIISWHPSLGAADTDLENPAVPSNVEEQTYFGQQSCTITAATLFLTGCLQLLLVGGPSPTVRIPLLNATSGRTALFRILGIGLPLYAAFQLDSFVVALALSLLIASGFPDLLSGKESKSSAQERLATKNWSGTGLRLFLSLLAACIATSWSRSSWPGYVALLSSIFLLHPPFPAAARVPQLGAIPNGKLQQSPSSADTASSLEDATLNILCGAALALMTATFSFTRGTFKSDSLNSFFLTLVAGSLTALFISVPRGALRSPHKVGLLISAAGAALLSRTQNVDLIMIYASRLGLAVMAFFVSRFDDKHLRLEAHSHDHNHHSQSHAPSEPSSITRAVLEVSEPYPLLHSILKARDSRSIFYFMSLNFGFMLVQLTYGFLTGSLGLLSDSIHMFFDCLALVVGLCAAVMSKWPPSARFPYGYGKVDTLSGFANGIFLMIISIEIIYEAIERLYSGSEVRRIGELLIVSLAGLCVNLVGIMAFEHGHAHGHDHGHSHSHGNENMHGIFLHILADTLGSVAVVISTILVHFYGWPGFDPIASCLIAILIFVSAIPLVSSTAKTLLLTIPDDVEYNLRDTLAGVSTLRGVVGYTVPKFWLDDITRSSAHDHGHHHHHDHGHDHSHTHSHSHSHSHDHDHHHGHHHGNHHGHGYGHEHNHRHDHSHDEKHHADIQGVIHVIASRSADLEDVRQRTVHFLREKNMDVLVQVEREGDTRCWCGNGSKTPST